MDFNIGNLVSGVVGAVARAATAIVNALSPIAKVGGILGAIAGAVLGAAAVVANVCEDGKIDADEAEELFNKAFKLVIGAFMLSFGSGLSGSESDDGVPTDHVSYIFYQPGVISGDKKHSFDKQAAIQKIKYEEKYPGTDVNLVPVNSPGEFQEEWTKIDDESKSVDVVEIILHGSIEL